MTERKESPSTPSKTPHEEPHDPSQDTAQAKPEPAIIEPDPVRIQAKAHDPTIVLRIRRLKPGRYKTWPGYEVELSWPDTFCPVLRDMFCSARKEALYRVVFDNTEMYIKGKGPRQYYRLLSEPRVCQPFGLLDETGERHSESQLELADDGAIRQCEQELERLESKGDPSSSEREEIARLRNYLGQVKGLGGRIRKTRTHQEKQRDAVLQALRRCRDEVAQYCQELADHLEERVREHPDGGLVYECDREWDTGLDYSEDTHDGNGPSARPLPNTALVFDADTDGTILHTRRLKPAKYLVKPDSIVDLVTWPDTFAPVPGSDIYRVCFTSPEDGSTENEQEITELYVRGKAAKRYHQLLSTPNKVISFSPEAKDTVQKAFRRCRDMIHKSCPALAEHLRECVQAVGESSYVYTGKREWDTG